MVCLTFQSFIHPPEGGGRCGSVENDKRRWGVRRINEKRREGETYFLQMNEIGFSLSDISCPLVSHFCLSEYYVDISVFLKVSLDASCVAGRWQSPVVRCLDQDIKYLCHELKWTLKRRIVHIFMIPRGWIPLISHPTDFFFFIDDFELNVEGLPSLLFIFIMKLIKVTSVFWFIKGILQD